MARSLFAVGITSQVPWLENHMKAPFGLKSCRQRLQPFNYLLLLFEYPEIAVHRAMQSVPHTRV
jgi:hypothetical protein